MKPVHYTMRFQMNDFSRNWPLMIIVFLLAWGACFCIAHAQSVEEFDVEKLTKSQLGPYRPEVSADVQVVAEQVIRATNQFRNEEGLDALREDKKLRQAAEQFAQFMAQQDRYGHRADGRQPSQRVQAADYQICLVAENISFTFKTKGVATDALAETIVNGWQESPSHRENMLIQAATETGVAIAQSDTTGAYYAVQLLARPESQAFRFSLENASQDTIHYQFRDNEFSLPAGFKRTHHVCRGGKLTLLRNKQAADAESQVADEVQVEDDIQLVV